MAEQQTSRVTPTTPTTQATQATQVGQQWEYCELRLYSSKSHPTKGRREKRQWSYQCTLRYYSPQGEMLRVQLTTLNEPVDFHPFGRAVGLLGARGWELVSTQYGISIGPDPDAPGSMREGGYIRWDNRMAFFKRPVVEGRAVDEPKLEF
jgi:hypothetical protein